MIFILDFGIVPTLILERFPHCFWNCSHTVFGTVPTLILELFPHCFWNCYHTDFGTVTTLILERFPHWFWNSSHTDFGTVTTLIFAFHFSFMTINLIDIKKKKKSIFKKNLAEMCQSKIFLKMVIILSSSNSLIEIVLKWLRKRGVTGFLPPPETQRKY